MNKIKVAAVQMQCEKNKNINILKAEESIRKAASEGAKLVLLPELFERNYFCQERNYNFYSYAETVSESETIKSFSQLAKELNVVIPVSFYEKDKNCLYNSVAMIDADGSLLGVYRKTHIPDDHFYQEKFYFSAGNTGFRVFETKIGNVGVGICWDQWFPETARCLALLGADIILYPTAIGSEPLLECDSMPHWRRVMQGHSAANMLPVVAANRIGTETVLPCVDNSNQSSSLCFYGSSFMTDVTGGIISSASRDKEEIIYAEYDFKDNSVKRLEWGLFRDRRPEKYSLICDKNDN